MPYHDLSESDVTLLRELLKEESRTLPTLIHHSRTWRAKEDLRSRLLHTETLLEKLRVGGPARRAAR